MCCDGTGYTEDKIDGKCEECNQPTVEGEAFVSCGHSEVECKKCGFAPCTGAC